MGTRSVALNNTVQSAMKPSHYRASENSSFSGVTWKLYSSAPEFTLSATPGQKTVYFQVKARIDKQGQTAVSNTATASITYVLPDLKVEVEMSPVVKAGDSLTVGLVVTNDGWGIPQEKLFKLYNSFVNPDFTVTRVEVWPFKATCEIGRGSFSDGPSESDSIECTRRETRFDPFVVELSVRAPGKPTSATMRSVIDSTNIVHESDENNNRVHTSITVMP